ncbi:hypothetical protein C8R44DRAFT_729194 [Mycena epipterygia]|nr:hypothetical protein C8R44DRAFT_729194 [Mycena epipterygia]
MWRGVRGAGGGDNGMADGSSNSAGSRSELKCRGVRRTKLIGHGEKQGSEGRPSTEAAGRGRERRWQGCRLMSRRRCGPYRGYSRTGETHRQREAVTRREWARRRGDAATQDRKTPRKGRKGQVKPNTYLNVNQHACASQTPGYASNASLVYSKFLAGGRASGTVLDEDADMRAGEDGSKGRRTARRTQRCKHRTIHEWSTASERRAQCQHRRGCARRRSRWVDDLASTESTRFRRKGRQQPPPIGCDMSDFGSIVNLATAPRYCSVNPLHARHRCQLQVPSNLSIAIDGEGVIVRQSHVQDNENSREGEYWIHGIRT